MKNDFSSKIKKYLSYRQSKKSKILQKNLNDKDINKITNELKTIIETNPSNSIEINMEINTQQVTTIMEQTTHNVQAEPIKTTNIVIHCEPGYYLPIGNSNICKQCSVKGCENCHGNTTHNFCDSCFSNYIPRYINNNLVCSFEFDNNCDY